MGAQRALLSNGWALKGSVLDLDWLNNRAARYGRQVGTIASQVNVVRATVGYQQNAAGVWQLYPASVLRLSSLGCIVEPAATNLALWCRDFTNAAWVKVNVTAALTATGIDGNANAASTLTATANAGTILQTITLGSAARTLSVWVKRRTGVGTVSISQDGIAWTDVTASLNTVTFSKVTLTATQLNPVIGFQFGTSGNAIDVDFCALEAGAYSTSPILTTTASATRDADLIMLNNVDGINLAQGTWFLELQHSINNGVQGSFICMTVDSTNLVRMRRNNNYTVLWSITTAGSTVAAITTPNAMAVNGVYRAAGMWGINDFRDRCSVALGADQADDTSGLVPTGIFTIAFGFRPAAASGSTPDHYCCADLRRTTYFSDGKSNTNLAAWAQAPVIS